MYYLPFFRVLSLIWNPQGGTELLMEEEVQSQEIRREANRQSARRYYHRKRVVCG